TRSYGDWSSDVCSSDLGGAAAAGGGGDGGGRPRERGTAGVPARLRPQPPRHRGALGGGTSGRRLSGGGRGHVVVHPLSHTSGARSEERRVGKGWRDGGA